MAQPRFLFVARARSRSDSWSRWQAGSRDATPDVLPADALRSSAWVAWRLVGANNRELGRSPQTYPDLVDCTASVNALRLAVANAQATVAVDPSTGCWFWRLESAGNPIAAAGRAYQRQRECLYSLEQFQRAAPGALVGVQTVVDLRNPESPVELLPLARRAPDAKVYAAKTFALGQSS